jgi:uncharacterized membrane protein
VNPSKSRITSRFRTHTQRSMSRSLSLAGSALFAALGLAPSCVSTWVQDEAEAETAPHDYSAIDSTHLPGPSEKVSFTRHVKPILQTKCVACHTGTDASAGYRLDQKEVAFTLGPRGPRISPGNPGKSLLLNVAGTHRNAAVMPPVGNRLTEVESQLLTRWIEEGAPWPEGAAGHLRAP